MAYIAHFRKYNGSFNYSIRMGNKKNIHRACISQMHGITWCTFKNRKKGGKCVIDLNICTGLLCNVCVRKTILKFFYLTDWAIKRQGVQRPSQDVKGNVFSWTALNNDTWQRPAVLLSTMWDFLWRFHRMTFPLLTIQEFHSTEENISVNGYLASKTLLTELTHILSIFICIFIIL